MAMEIRKTYYDNGNIETERAFNGGSENGPAKGWYESGELEFESVKLAGVAHGLVKNYYKNGNLRIECNYVLSEPDGCYKAYFENGQLQTLRNFDRGTLCGIEKNYNEDGTLQSEIEHKNSDTEIIPTEIKSLEKGAKCTVFLTNSKEHLLVIFKATYDEEYIDEVLDHTVAKDTIDGYDTIVNLTEDESVDLKEYPPVLIKCSSQSVLNILHHYMPEKKFFLVYSWYDIDDSKYAYDEYEDYLYALLDLLESDDKLYKNDNGEIEVVKQLHRVYVTDMNSGEEEPGREILNFPGSATMKIASEVGCGPNFEYDNLRVFEEKVFNNLEVKNIDGQVEIEEEDFPIAPELLLDVEEYKSKVILEY
tara:strand:+ start:532 stop:1623 length:1092 start_codon:yes stop_codon:yes gene_type:complete